MTRALRILVPLVIVVISIVILEDGHIFPEPVHLQVPNGSLVAPPANGQGSQSGGTAAQQPAAAAAPNAAHLALSVHPSSNASHGYVVGAEVRTPDGTPAGDATVSFYEAVDFFGPREELLGTATTDSSGSASFTYLPATTGSHRIVARSSGIAKVASGQASETFTAAIAAPAYRDHVPAITAFYNLVPYGVGVVVLAVWLLIAFALIGTARGVARGAREQKEKGVIA